MASSIANSSSAAPGAPAPETDGKRPMFYDTAPDLGTFRHVDAGYGLAQDVARPRGAKIPGGRQEWGK